MVSRFYCPGTLSPGQTVALPAETAHHALRVLRLREGDAVAVFDGEGNECAGTLIGRKDSVGVVLREPVSADRESPLRVTLVQALAVAEKMDWIVQKAVELGVAVVQPVEAERCVMRLSGERVGRRVAHWHQVAVGAAEQCGRSRLCAVHEPASLRDWLARPAAGPRWILAPEAGDPLSAQPAPDGPVALLVGPEGGWSEAELAAAQVAGCRPVRLGPRVLRTETAGIAAVAAMMALWGDF